MRCPQGCKERRKRNCVSKIFVSCSLKRKYFADIPYCRVFILTSVEKFVHCNSNQNSSFVQRLRRQGLPHFWSRLLKEVVGILSLSVDPIAASAAALQFFPPAKSIFLHGWRGALWEAAFFCFPLGGWFEGGGEKTSPHAISKTSRQVFFTFGPQKCAVDLRPAIWKC